MKSQKELIEKQDWDVLIILDACRYDYFEKVYSDYLDGDLKKVKSEGTSTLEWLNKTFEGFWELKYYSGNPFVNSVGMEQGGFKATEHFSEIVDVWDFGWSEEGTVLPWEINKAYDGDNPAIIHYMQPHRPFLTLDEDSSEGIAHHKLRGTATLMQRIRSWAGNLCISVLGDFRTVKLSEFIRGEENLIGWGSICREVGAKRIVDAYVENLRIVLEKVSELVDEIEHSVVVSADHGEVFGQEGRWGHPGERQDISDLVEVPWLEVRK